MTGFNVAVVGGGAAGTFFIAELLRRQSGWSVLWLTGDDSVGVAYNSRFDSHLLNVPAVRMGAFADQSHHFHDWLNAHAAPDRYEGTDFVPRRLYGNYLDHLRKEARKDSHVNYLTQSIVDAEPVTIDSKFNWRLISSRNEVFHAERLVIASGIPESTTEPNEDGIMVRSPWKWFHDQAKVPRLPSVDKEIVVLGSGLTAMDVVIGLRDLGFTGRIRVKSRSGKWSTQHEKAQALTQDETSSLVKDLLDAPTCRSYIRVFRRHATTHAWRSVLDALRSRSQDLWSALELSEKRRFLRHVFPLWNRHRHRAPPKTAERIRRDAQLVIERGRWPAEKSDASLVFDCRGLGLTSSRNWPPYFVSLQKNGAVATSDLDIGLVSRQPKSVAILGALRFGDEFECTAVPELRSQASAVVDAWMRDAS